MKRTNVIRLMASAMIAVILMACGQDEGSKNATSTKKSTTAEERQEEKASQKETKSDSTSLFSKKSPEDLIIGAWEHEGDFEIMDFSDDGKVIISSIEKKDKDDSYGELKSYTINWTINDSTIAMSDGASSKYTLTEDTLTIEFNGKNDVYKRMNASDVIDYSNSLVFDDGRIISKFDLSNDSKSEEKRCQL